MAAWFRSRARVPASAEVAALWAAALAALLSGCGADLVLPPNPVTLRVDGAGSGSGMVATTLGPAPALKCTILEGAADSGACSATYAVGSRVTLAADPADGSRFTGWGGACSGLADCAVALNDSVRVLATFETARFTLTIVGAGTGSGSVKSATGALPLIACQITAGQTSAIGCDGDFLISGNRLTLTATPLSNSTFSGWGGDCSGTAPCSVLLDGNRVVSAAFVLRR